MDTLADTGVHIDYLRLRGFPFAGAVAEFIEAHKTVFVVEQNRDAQMRLLLIQETGADPSRLSSLLHYNGLPIPSDVVVNGVNDHISKEAAA